MKIVLANAATLPAYRSKLAGLIMNATASRTINGERQLLILEEAESDFYSLRAALAKGERLLWVAWGEYAVTCSTGFV